MVGSVLNQFFALNIMNACKPPCICSKRNASRSLFSVFFRMSMHGDFECPFSWKPDIGSSVYNIFEVIDEAKSKMERHPFLEDAYKSVLVYLYTRPAVADYNMAWDWLEQIKDNNMPADFMKRANRFYLNKLLNENCNNDCEVEILSRLWNSRKTKSAIFIMKGATFNCFGPKLYQKAVDAYEDAITVSQNMEKAVSVAADISNLLFYALWGQAYSMSRITGLTFNKPPTRKELKIWDLANKRRFQIQSLDVVEHMWFCCQFAESMMTDKKKKDPCLKLVGSVFSKWEGLSETRKVHNTGMLLICNKVLKRYGESELFGKEEADLFQGMMKVTEDFLKVWNEHDEKFKKSYLKPLLNSLKIYKKCVRRKKAVGKFPNLRLDVEKYLGNNIDYHILLSRTYDYEAENEKAIRLLEVAKNKLDRHSRNILIDLELLNRQTSLKKDEKWTRREYESLLLRYSDCNRNSANILLKRSQYLFHEAKKHDYCSLKYWDYMEGSMEDLIAAKSSDPELVIQKKHCGLLQRVLEKNRDIRPEYLAWVYYKIVWNENRADEIFCLFEKSIGSLVSKQRNFSLEHLGRFCLYERKDFERAINLFRVLPVQNEHRKYLLCQSVLKQQEKLDTARLSVEIKTVSEDLLLECLELGNYDVIEPILSLLENRKNNINLKHELLKRGFFNQDQSHLFFSRKSYEICAMIEFLIGRNCEIGFFVDRTLQVSNSFREGILRRIAKLLEIPTDSPKHMASLWRRRRLDATKIYVVKSVRQRQNLENVRSYFISEEDLSELDKMQFTEKWNSVKNEMRSNSPQTTEMRTQSSSQIDKPGKRRWNSSNDQIKLANFSKLEAPVHVRQKSNSETVYFDQVSNYLDDVAKSREITAIELARDLSKRSKIASNGTKEHYEMTSNSPNDLIESKTKFHRKGRLKACSVFSNEEEYAFNLKLTDLFRDARNPLDRCVKKLCPTGGRNCYHPFAFKSKKEQGEDKMTAMLDMGLDEIKDILTKDFEIKGLYLTNDVCGAINFMAEREFHIIQKQGAWHAVWVEAINDDKHNEAWNMDTFEKDLKKYRDIGQTEYDVTAYDVAHWAADFAEQSMILLNIPCLIHTRSQYLTTNKTKPVQSEPCHLMIFKFRQNMFWSRLSHFSSIISI